MSNLDLFFLYNSENGINQRDSGIFSTNVHKCNVTITPDPHSPGRTPEREKLWLFFHPQNQIDHLSLDIKLHINHHVWFIFMLLVYENGIQC